MDNSIILQNRMKKKMFFVTILVISLGLPNTYGVADSVATNEEDSPVCDPKCGCDGYYIYDEIKNDCIINLPKLMKSVEIRYDSKTDEELLAKDGMAKTIYIEGQKLFRGILISVILFITCATICAISACFYCCRINYSDRKLKREVEALAKKMHKKCPSRKAAKPKEEDPKSENCNVVVQSAGVFVV